jgi:predicted transcriptional regulator
MIVTIEKTDLPDLLFQDLDGLIEVREIDKQGNSKPYFFASLEEFKSYTPPLDKHVYVGVFSRLKQKGPKKKGDKEHCLHTWAVWADFDGKGMSLDIAKERIASAGLPEPSIFVDSGKGIHSYWLLTRSVEKDKQEVFEGVLKAIVDKAGADPKAAEIARVMRIPGTFNVKDEVQKFCTLLEVHEENRYPFELFTEILDVDVTSAPREVQSITELETSNMSCIRLIAKGVKKRQRNFALGKITAYLKRQGHSRKEVFEIVQAWNENNDPAKPFNELKDQFNRLWDGPWKFLGCHFTNPDLERINKELCPIGECAYHATNDIQVVNEYSLIIDNYLFKPTMYPQVMGLDLAVYAAVLKAEEGITRKHLAYIINRDIEDRSLRQSLNRLLNMEFLTIKKGVKKAGQQDRYFVAARSNYGRGYTIINPLLNEVYLGGRITDNEYKLLVLLKSYSFGKVEVYPTRETLAVLTGLKENSIRKILKSLESKQYIKRDYKPLGNGKEKMFIKLKF